MMSNKPTRKNRCSQGGKGIARSRRHSIARNKNTHLEIVPPARSTPTFHPPTQSVTDGPGFPYWNCDQVDRGTVALGSHGRGNLIHLTVLAQPTFLEREPGSFLDALNE